MHLDIKGMTIEFSVIPLKVSDHDISDVFTRNQKLLFSHYEKAKLDSKNRLHKITKSHFEKYIEHHNLPLGKFLNQLKTIGNDDYKYYLNKYGDQKFCRYKISSYLKDKGIYCYIVDGRIMYVGRCRHNFNSRINNDYGNITAYNSLIDGQATNCHINSLINAISKDKEVFVGIYSMSEKTNDEIVSVESLF